jgi:hypothetical protein
VSACRTAYQAGLVDAVEGRRFAPPAFAPGDRAGSIAAYRYGSGYLDGYGCDTQEAMAWLQALAISSACTPLNASPLPGAQAPAEAPAWEQLPLWGGAR